MSDNRRASSSNTHTHAPFALPPPPPPPSPALRVSLILSVVALLLAFVGVCISASAKTPDQQVCGVCVCPVCAPQASLSQGGLLLTRVGNVHQVAELSKLVDELISQNEILSTDLGILMERAVPTIDDDVVPNPIAFTDDALEELSEQVADGRDDIDVLFKEITDLQDRVAILEQADGGGSSGGGGEDHGSSGGDGGGSSGGDYSYNYADGWLSEFMSVEVEDDQTKALIINAPIVSIRTPQLKTVTEEIQGQVGEFSVPTAVNSPQPQPRPRP